MAICDLFKCLWFWRKPERAPEPEEQQTLSVTYTLCGGKLEEVPDAVEHFVGKVCAVTKCPSGTPLMAWLHKLADIDERWDALVDEYSKAKLEASQYRRRIDDVSYAISTAMQCKSAMSSDVRKVYDKFRSIIAED